MSDQAELRLVLPKIPGISDDPAKANPIQGWTVATGATCFEHGAAVLIVASPELAARAGAFLAGAEVEALVECLSRSAAQAVHQLFRDRKIARA